MDSRPTDYYRPPSAAHYPYYSSPGTLADVVPPGVAPPPPASVLPQYPSPAFVQRHSSYYASHYALDPHLALPSSEEVRTLFISGLPDDVKHREIFNLFREFPGYQSSQIRCLGNSKQAVAFAVFSSQQAAVSAMNATNGMVFDLEKDSTLFVQLAKSNSRSKRSRTDVSVSYASNKYISGSSAYSRGFPDPGRRSNVHNPGIDSSAYNLNGYPSARSYVQAFNHAEPDKLENFKPRNNTPCATLFVANLGPACSELELHQVFSRCPGFLKLKMQNKNGNPVAFVDFEDVACSTGALEHLQGVTLYSSVGEGVRLEFAKSRMGCQKRERRE